MLSCSPGTAHSPSEGLLLTALLQQIQAELGEGHVNLVKAQAVLLTPSYLGIVMEYASGGNLTQYVTDKWESAEQRNGLFLDEDEANYIFKVGAEPDCQAIVR